MLHNVKDVFRAIENVSYLTVVTLEKPSARIMKSSTKCLAAALLITLSLLFTLTTSYAQDPYSPDVSVFKAKEMIKLFKSSIKKSPNDAKLHLSIGNMYNIVREHELARRYMDKAIELGANKEIASFGIGYAQNRLGYYDEAVKSLNTATANDQVKGKAYCEIGYSYFKLKKYDDSNKNLDKALAQDKSLAGRVNLYKGLIKYEQKSYDGALIDLKASLKATDDSVVKSSARNFINAIKKRQQQERNFLLVVSLSFLYDDNVLAVSDSQSVSISEKADIGGVGYIRGAYYPVKSEGNTLLLSYMFYQKQYEDLTAFDLQDSNILVNYSTRLSDFGSFSLKYDYDYYNLDYTRYFQRNKGKASLRINGPQRAHIVLSAFVESKEHFIQDDLSGKDFGGGLSQVFEPATDKKFNIDFNYNEENARNDDFDYKGNEFRLGFSLPAGYETTLSMNLGLYLKKYKKTHSSFGVKRDDRHTTAYIRLKRELSSNYALALRYDYTYNESNINIYEYKRNVAYLELRYLY